MGGGGGTASPGCSISVASVASASARGYQELWVHISVQISNELNLPILASGLLGLAAGNFPAPRWLSTFEQRSNFERQSS
jgi:hypothetical protein